MASKIEVNKETELIKNEFTNYISENNLNLILLDGNNGHVVKKGSDSGHQNKNPYYHVLDVDSNEEYILMKCNDDIFIKISSFNMEAVKSTGSTWFLCKNGYIAGRVDGVQTYLHRFLMGSSDNSSLSIDHINRDKLDNRIENLRFAKQSLQNSNRDKCDRKYNAQLLPPQISQMQIPMYCYYCSEIMNKGSDTEYIRDFFRIEKHPNLNKKCLSTSKSVKVSIVDKLKEAYKIIEKLDNNEYIEIDKKLPQYVRMYDSKRTPNKKVLEYERRINGKRESMRITINKDDNIDEKLEILHNKILEKYLYKITI